MSRWMAGGVLSALALAGITAFATAGAAQEPDPVGGFQGEADLVPVAPLAGESVTASDSSCFEGTDGLWWALRLEGEVVPSLTGFVPQAEDGSWEVTFDAPNEGGNWLFFAICVPPGAPTDDLVAHIDSARSEEPDTELMEEWGVDAYLYYAHIVQVDGPTPTTPVPETPGTTTTTTPVAAPPAAPPAQPVPGQPTFTG